MSTYRGDDGTVSVAGKAVAQIKAFFLYIARDIGYVGIKEWGGSFEATRDLADTTGQFALHNALDDGTPVDLVLKIDATKNYRGTAYITNEGVEHDVGDVTTITFDFEGTGPCNEGVSK